MVYSRTILVIRAFLIVQVGEEASIYFEVNVVLPGRSTVSLAKSGGEAYGPTKFPSMWTVWLPLFVSVFVLSTLCLWRFLALPRFLALFDAGA